MCNLQRLAGQTLAAKTIRDAHHDRREQFVVDDRRDLSQAQFHFDIASGRIRIGAYLVSFLDQ
jgi:hypothetical protein